MRILVTGGAGYIGGTVAGLLAAQGHKPIIFDNLSHAALKCFPPGVDFVQGDLADRAAIEKLFISAQTIRATLSTASCTSPPSLKPANPCKAGDLFPQQHRLHTRPSRSHRCPRPPPPRLLLDCRRVR